MEAIEARAYNDVDGMVCSVWITEPALIDAIRTEGQPIECDYCNTVPTTPDATIELDRVVHRDR